MKSRFETLWEAFVEQQRRVRAPEALHRRVRALIREAAATGSRRDLPTTNPHARRAATAAIRRGPGGDAPR